MKSNQTSLRHARPLALMAMNEVAELVAPVHFPAVLTLHPGASMFTLCESADIRLKCSAGVLASLESSEELDEPERNAITAASMLVAEARGMLAALFVGIRASHSALESPNQPAA